VSLLIGCSAAWLAMELMSRWYERRRAVPDDAAATPALAPAAGPNARARD
jgi:hypothetical protein